MAVCSCCCGCFSPMLVLWDCSHSKKCFNFSLSKRTQHWQQYYSPGETIVTFTASIHITVITEPGSLTTVDLVFWFLQLHCSPRIQRLGLVGKGGPFRRLIKLCRPDLKWCRRSRLADVLCTVSDNRSINLLLFYKRNSSRNRLCSFLHSLFTFNRCF